MLIVHFIYECMYMQVLPATPPPGMGILNDMWGTPPPFCESFFSTVCILFALSCVSPSFTVPRVLAETIKQVDIGPGVR